MTPNDMPRRIKRSRQATAIRHAHCQDGARCVGPGCKADTGKTKRKGKR